MKNTTVFPSQRAGEITGARTIGIDIGSRSAKGVLLADGEIFTALTPTGFFMKQTAQNLFEQLFEQSGLGWGEIDYVVGTGYGRIALDLENTPHQIVTEISCHGLGAHFLGENVHTVVDIGGQDSKAIRVDPDTGKVLDFVMNDKCAAGTGRFLEKMANVLGFDVERIGEVSLQATKPSVISSQCVVFAESELISGRAKGETVENLAAGIHISVAKRIINLLNRVGIEPGVLFTGGVSNNVGMIRALEEILGLEIGVARLDTVFAGALGAALYAQRYTGVEERALTGEGRGFALDLTAFRNSVEKRKEEYIQKSTGQGKNVAYLCAYTPIEVLGAADVSHLRLLHAGTPVEVASGERITQSVFCEFTKSCIGGFAEGNPLFAAIDKVYTFYTCDCMKKTAEAIGENFVPTTILNLPRLRDRKESRDYFKSEIEGFRRDLEILTGSKIEDGEVNRQIGLYNRAKQLYREISAFRKVSVPALSGKEFQELALGYYYLPAEELLPLLEDVSHQLKMASPSGKRPIRLMLAGGIVAEGDYRVINIIEQQIGARIVVEDNCTGYKPFANDVPQTGDVYGDLADGYLGKAPCARMKPLSERINLSASLAEEYGVDGVIFYYMKFCPCYGIAKNEFVHKFQEMGLPVLEIPSDYSHSDEGQLKTRIEAFIEVLGERG